MSGRAIHAAGLLALAACGGAELPRDLRTGLHTAGTIEVIAPPGPLLDAARRAGAALARERGLEVLVRESGAEVGAGSARVVLGTMRTPEARELAAQLGVEEEGDGFHFAGRSYAERGDLLAATLPDPLRPGRPATLFLGVDEGALARHVVRIDPGWRPAFRSFQGGDPERDGPLARPAGGGPFRPAGDGLVVRFRQIAERRGGLTDQVVNGVHVWLPRAMDRDRAQAYLVAARAARQRTANALGVTTNELEVTRVQVYDDAEEMEELLGALDLSLVNRTAGVAHVLLVPGVADDGGAAAGRACALERWGTPAEEGLLEGLGVWAAGSWWGIGLEEWGAMLPPAGDAGELLPPHWAALVGALQDAGGSERLHAAWSAPAPLDDPEVRAMLDERLAAWVQRAPPRGAPKDAPDLGLGVVWTRGPRGYHSAEALLALDRLTALGVDSVAVPVYAWPERARPVVPDGRALPRVRRSVGDVEFAVAAARARERGLKVAVAGYLLTSRSGSWYGVSPLAANSEQINAFFDALDEQTADLASVAGRAGADLFCVADGIPGATATLAQPGESPVLASAREARRAGWDRVLGRLRASSDISFAIVARGAKEVEGSAPWPGAALHAEQLFEGVAAMHDDRRREELAGDLRAIVDRAQARALPALVFGAGYPGTASAHRSPRAPLGATDPYQRARLLDALLGARAEVLAEGAQLRGLILWSWSTDPLAGGSEARGHVLSSGPAEEVLRRWLADS